MIKVDINYQFHKILEQTYWITFYSCENAEYMFKEFVLNVSESKKSCIRIFFIRNNKNPIKYAADEIIRKIFDEGSTEQDKWQNINNVGSSGKE